jgi:hypothetical protein
MVPGAQRVDRTVDGDQLPLLTREVLPPREALCDSCLGFEQRRRRMAMTHMIWVSAVFVAIANEILRVFS